MDILADLGPIALGSRLKRLSERLMADAARLLEQGRFSMQPAQVPLLAALDRYGPLTVTEAVSALGATQPAVTRHVIALVDLGLVNATPTPADRRIKTLELTPAGRVAIGRIRAVIWPALETAVEALCDGRSAAFLDAVRGIEAAFEARSLLARARRETTILPYADALAPAFRSINEEWITAMFALEDADRKVLNDPKATILDPGGDILFADLAGVGIVGTCALKPSAPGVFELTKMGVLEAARGKKVGEYLLGAMLERAAAMGVRELYLLTNTRCAAAIHLYEKLGFVHDKGIMARFGGDYARCDVAMSFPV